MGGKGSFNALLLSLGHIWQPVPWVNDEDAYSKACVMCWCMSVPLPGGWAKKSPVPKSVNALCHLKSTESLSVEAGGQHRWKGGRRAFAYRGCSLSAVVCIEIVPKR